MIYQLKSPPCIAELVDGEYVVINLDSGKYYNIVGVGAEVFKSLTEGVKVSSLLESCCGNAAFAKALHDFIELAVSENLLKEVDSLQSTDVPLPIIDLSSGLESLSINVYTDMQELLGLDPIHEVDVDQGWPHQS
ncbi:MAG: hypothetical protein FGM17_09160 [Polynucleobacter sp.]|uniref:hypothetical protein n=1 Tax=Polynucleobacter sp. TaxID=2029855 RepID=UPI00216BE59E|nr:hypothetical protein [Polynucleobacter sp.]MBU3670871.1 hypothetical protein [Polynucleobacter sp.]